MKRSIELSGKSQSTLMNYARCLSTMTLYFKCNPLELDDKQILDYLHHLTKQSKSPSLSYFKYTLYGLRFAYRVKGMEPRLITLPSLNLPKKLPVVLSFNEVKLLLRTPKLLKYRMFLAMLYGCELRRSELINISLEDIDFDRRMLHIQEGKEKYLFPVKAMSKVFRARFAEELRKFIYIDDNLYRILFAKKWVVYCKRPFFGPKQVIEYLERYTHKVAISNHRIKSLDNESVTFSAKDYRKGGRIHSYVSCTKNLEWFF